MSMNSIDRFLSFFFCLILAAHISGCGKGHDDNHTNAESGSAVFGIIWPDEVYDQGTHSVKATLPVDCAGISTIKVDVYEGSSDILLADDSFPCSDRKGTVSGIPVGEKRRFVVSVLGDLDTLLYQGEKDNIVILKNQTAIVGFIAVERVEQPGPLNRSPEATITLPKDKNIFTYGDEIIFEGTGVDTEDGQLTGDSLQWESSLDDHIGTGSPLNTNVLSVGDHRITLRVTDSKGASGTDTIQITVSQVRPVVATIIQPQENATFTYGEEITFEGTGEDTEGGQLIGDSLQWESSLDDHIGTGSSLNTNGLSVGDHRITLRVTDSKGASGTDTIQITVSQVRPVVATIIQPQENATFTYGEEITFEGTGEDTEGGQLTGDSLQWESNLDDHIGTGSPLNTDGLSVGDHKITLTVTDKNGGIGTATTQIAIRPSGNSIGMHFKIIPAGTFTMGSPKDEPGKDWWKELQHEVTLSQPFNMQTTEVTQGQWKAVMGEDTNPSTFSECGDDCPVETVTWYDCVIFCNRLSQKEGLTPSYYKDSFYTTVFDFDSIKAPYTDVFWNQDANGYRLPTEAEWEYAARAKSKTAFANGEITLFDGGMSECNNDTKLDDMGWYCNNNGEDGILKYGPKLVEQKKPNDWGLFDMHGNVSEWCQDWYNIDYPDHPVTDPTGPSSDYSRVARGGAWHNVAAQCRAASRGYEWPYSEKDYLGFRLVLPSGQ